MKGIGGSTAQAELATLSRWPDPAPAISASEYERRIERARKLMRADGADALLVSAGGSLRYFAGIGWGASERLVAMLIPVSGVPLMIAPAFELGTLEAELAVPAALALWEEDESPFVLLAEACAAQGIATLALDPGMAWMFVDRVRSAAPRVCLSEASSIVDGCRMLKSPAEIALLQQAKSMTLEVQRRAALILDEGIRASEVRQFIDAAHQASGAAGSSFCIVHFGRATAFPHGLPADDVLREGDMVLIDTGCTVQGYHSDITRSYVFGHANDDQRRIWDLEKAAQAAAFGAARPGATCESVDAAARGVIEAAGLGPDYRLPGLPHRTGHGIGLAIHEPAYLVRGDRTVLADGMCFSNEPMIVVPDRFGVRLEDHFHITGDGAQWFTPPSPAIDAPFG